MESLRAPARTVRVTSHGLAIRVEVAETAIVAEGEAIHSAINAAVDRAPASVLKATVRG